MSETIASGITIIIPSLGDVNWATLIKDSCFQKISEHDHTGGGKGVQIGTAAIANLAVTTGKIADLAVTTAKIANTAITTGKVLDEAITEAKLAPDAATRSTLLYEITNQGIADGSAAIAETTVRKRMPKAGVVTHITAEIEQTTAGATITGGTLKFTVYENGVTTGKDVDLTSGQSGNAGDTSTGTFSFAQGDLLSIATTKSSVTMTAGSQFFSIQVWGHFTV